MFRLATNNDLTSIMQIVKDIQEEMKNENNPQWNAEDDYPNIDKFSSDIYKKELYVYEDNQIIKGFMTISMENDYQDLLKTSDKKAYILHHLAVKSNYRKEGIATMFLNFAEDLARTNNIEVLKADTEEHNVKMNNLFLKLGFKEKGEFEYDDYPGHYIYYEKDLK